MYELIDLACAFCAGTSLIMVFVALAKREIGVALCYVFSCALNAALALW